MQLDALQPIAGAQLIVLSEHMNYWNESWPDPFASTKLTARQEDYVRALNRSSPYTPQLIVDGTMELRLNMIVRRWNASLTQRLGALKFL